ncbi:hypothetical protein QT397_13050 [Microbulbifer sp. MKSA007]|nr:hypothetical protein QT397_13050 [Microbulbifer sp. MKSA007]
MAELKDDQDYKLLKAAQKQRFSKLEASFAEDEKDLVSEINFAGFNVTSVWDLVNRKNDYDSIAPILIKHLSIKHHPRIISGIARALALPSQADNITLWNTLKDLYINTRTDSEIIEPVERGCQEAIAVALETLATKSRVSDLKQIIDKVPNADGIVWLKAKLQKVQSYT